jgi:hypothetical protein
MDCDSSGGKTNSTVTPSNFPGCVTGTLVCRDECTLVKASLLEFRVDLMNAFNQRNYNYNEISRMEVAVSSHCKISSSANDYANASSANFLNNLLFNSSGRVIQLNQVHF